MLLTIRVRIDKTEINYKEKIELLKINVLPIYKLNLW